MKISNDIKTEMDALIANNIGFNEMYQELQLKYTITVGEITLIGESQGTIPCWTCKINQNEITIESPLASRDIESFVHELLHGILDSKGFSETKIVLNWINKLPHPIPFLLGEPNLLGHINNSLAHEKMYPYYDAHGFNPENFVLDYALCPVQDAYMDCINSDFYNAGLPNDAIGVYIGQFIACRYCLNDTFLPQIRECLNTLHTINNDLYDLCEEFLVEWSTIPERHNLAHIIRFAYKVRDWYNTNKGLFINGIS